MRRKEGQVTPFILHIVIWSIALIKVNECTALIYLPLFIYFSSFVTNKPLMRWTYINFIYIFCEMTNNPDNIMHSGQTVFQLKVYIATQ